MDILHNALMQQLAEIPTEILLRLIERKSAEQGVTLTPRELAEIRTKIEQQDWSQFTLRADEEGTSQKIELQFTADDVSKLEKQIDGLMKSMPETLVSLVDELALKIKGDLDANWAEEEQRRDAELVAFRNRLEERWHAPLSRLRQLIVIVTETGEGINQRLRSQAASAPFTYEVQTRLHARACQIANEVVALLSCGFADGAMARWRTLHEVAVTSVFIGNDEVLAELYRLHEAVESLRAARLHVKHAERLGGESLTKEQMADMEADVASLKQRFGRAYGEPYGWAADKLGIPSPHFDQIEAAVRVGHMRPYYKLASHNVHANPKGAFFRLGLMDQSEVLLAGPSNFGLADPGQNTALSLTFVTSALVQLDPTVDVMVALEVALALSDEIGESFVAVQKQIEAEELHRD
jgi:hypothetical protein